MSLSALLRWYLSPCLAGGRLAGTCKKYLGPWHCQDSYTFAAFGTSPGHPKVKGGRLLLVIDVKWFYTHGTQLDSGLSSLDTTIQAGTAKNKLACEMHA
jgi:hypothetical protein